MALVSTRRAVFVAVAKHWFLPGFVAIVFVVVALSSRCLIAGFAADTVAFGVVVVVVFVVAVFVVVVVAPNMLVDHTLDSVVVVVVVVVDCFVAKGSVAGVWSVEFGMTVVAEASVLVSLSHCSRHFSCCSAVASFAVVARNLVELVC